MPLLTPLSTAIAKRVAAQPAHYQAGIHAYRVALDERKDWHAAVSAAIEAALERKAYDDGKPDAPAVPPEERCTCGNALFRKFMETSNERTENDADRIG